MYIGAHFAFGESMRRNYSIQHVVVSGTFNEMGRQYANTVGPKLLTQLKVMRTLMKPYSQTVEKVILAAKQRYTLEGWDFIQGESESDFAVQHQMKVDDFILLDQSIALSALISSPSEGSLMGNCSFIGIEEQGSAVVGRNYDWRKNLLSAFTTYPILLTLKPSQKRLYPNDVTLIGNVGEITTITYMTNKGLFLGLNSGVSASGPFQVWQRKSYFSQLFSEMFKVEGFEQLEEFLLQTSPDYGYIVNIAGPRHDQLASFEILPFNLQLGTYQSSHIPNNIFKVRRRGANNHYLVATNIFKLDNWSSYIGHKPPQQTPTFSKERQDNLTAIAKNRNIKNDSKNSIDLYLRGVMKLPLNSKVSIPGATEYATNVDPAYADNPDVTYYSLVFNTKSKQLYLRFQQITNGKNVWTSGEYDLKTRSNEVAILK
jgi:hypothetical protein